MKKMFSLAVLVAMSGASFAIPAVSVGGDNMGVLLRTGNAQLVGSCATSADCEKLAGFWKNLLAQSKIGVDNVTTTGGMLSLQYNAGGRIIKDFIAPAFLFNTADSAERTKSMEKITAALSERNLPVIAAFTMDNPEMAKTYRLYYLTDAKQSDDAVVMLRNLRGGNKIMTLLEKAGVKIIAANDASNVFYIGGRADIKVFAAIDQADAEKQLPGIRQQFAQRNYTLAAYEIGKGSDGFVIAAVGLPAGK